MVWTHAFGLIVASACASLLVFPSSIVGYRRREGIEEKLALGGLQEMWRKARAKAHVRLYFGVDEKSQIIKAMRPNELCGIAYSGNHRSASVKWA